MPRTKQRSSERARRRSLREQCSCDLSRFHPWRKEKTILYDVGKNKVPVGNAEWSDEAHDPFLKEHGLEMMELLVMAIYVSLLEGAGWTCMGINGSEACKTFHLPRNTSTSARNPQHGSLHHFDVLMYPHCQRWAIPKCFLISIPLWGRWSSSTSGTGSLWHGERSPHLRGIWGPLDWLVVGWRVSFLSQFNMFWYVLMQIHFNVLGGWGFRSFLPDSLYREQQHLWTKIGTCCGQKMWGCFWPQVSECRESLAPWGHTGWF